MSLFAGLFRAALIALPIVAVTHAASAEGKAPPQKIAILDSNVASYLPLYVGIEQGFFAAHDLEVEHKVVANASYTIAGLTSGSAQIGGASPFPVLQAVEAGVDLVALATTDVMPGPTHIGLLALPDSPISKPSDIAGKRIGVAGINGALHVFTSAWLKATGVDPASVTFVEIPFPQQSDALRQGNVDLITSADPFYQRMMNARAARLVADLQQGMPPNSSSNYYIATRKWAAAHPDAVAGFRDGLNEAIAFIAAHPGRARAILEQYTKLPADVIAQMPLPNYQSKATPEQLAHWATVATDIGLMDVDPAKLDVVLP